MKKLKTSWSILSQWERGNKRAALEMLSGKDHEPNQAMKTGLECHEFISKNKIRTFWYKDKPLEMLSEKAIFEDRANKINYYRVDINEWLEFSGMLDVKDDAVYDFKTGSKSSLEHDPRQLYTYSMLHSLATGEVLDKGVMMKVRLEGEKVILEDYSVYKITKQKLRYIHDYVQTVSQDIYLLWERNNFDFLQALNSI